MSQKLWVECKTPANTYGPTKVSIQDCEYVGDFLKEIKKESQLAIPQNTPITLFHSDGTTEIDVGDSPSLFVTGNSRATPLIVKTTSVFDLELDQLVRLDQLEQEIKQLENSEEYKTLAKKNRPWFGTPTEQEKGEWDLLNKKLDVLMGKEDFYQKTILSMNAKKSDKIRKRYKKDTAIKDERLLLSDVAIKMWERFGFTLEHYGKPTFGDFQWASGFKDVGDVRDYFEKKANGQVKEDDIKESFSEEQSIWLIDLNRHVNPLLHDKLITNEDGTLRLVLEHDVYEDGAGMAEIVIRTLYGPEKKFVIKEEV